MQRLQEFIQFIKKHDGINDKTNLTRRSKEQFNLTQDRTIYYCEEFAVRFSYSSRNSFSNTVLSLSQLQKYDHIPVLVCLITKEKNRIFLANSTFLLKISHSAQDLREDNIRGSFNGSNIARTFQNIENTESNIKELFSIHAGLSFADNLPRLVEATNNITPTGSPFQPNKQQELIIFASVNRAIQFSESADFFTLKQELDEKTRKFQNEILIASHIENSNIRGRIIEYLIAGENEELQKRLAEELLEEYPKLPAFSTRNTFGDFTRLFDDYHTETDVKTKILLLSSNPKAYNIDKFLEFHSRENTVFLFYFIGIATHQIFNKILIPAFQKDILQSTILLKHWAGRNSRGVTQFKGDSIHKLLKAPNKEIDADKSNQFLKDLLSL